MRVGCHFCALQNRLQAAEARSMQPSLLPLASSQAKQDRLLRDMHVPCPALKQRRTAAPAAGKYRGRRAGRMRSSLHRTEVPGTSHDPDLRQGRATKELSLGARIIENEPRKQRRATQLLRLSLPWATSMRRPSCRSRTWRSIQDQRRMSLL